MKKIYFAALLLLLCLLLGTALAQEAVNITSECTIKPCMSSYKPSQMTDGRYTSIWTSRKMVEPYVGFIAPAGTPICGLYVCFADMPSSYVIETSLDGDTWTQYCEGSTDYYHAYYNIPEGTDYVRLRVTSEAKTELKINEIFVLSGGTLPDWVQVWEPTHTKADILFVVAHPDDELMFLGGALPTYAVEQGRKVVVAYLGYSNTTRRSELLNGLWSMGIRNYPVIGSFGDKYTSTAEKAYKAAGGKAKVLTWVVELFRKYQPEVVVSHDVNGEYGHGQHKMLADAVMQAYELANEEAEYLDSYLEYGGWQVKKLYLHLYPENQITFDWSTPLVSAGGKTGIELATNAFKTYHLTQQGTKYTMEETGTKYDNQVFGLVNSTVGADVRKDDFLENIYSSVGSYTQVTPSPTPVPTATPAPSYASMLPATNEKGFLDDGEYVYANDTDGLYIFINQTCRIVIERKYDEEQPLTWFEAEIWSDVEAGELLQTIQYDPEKMGKARTDAANNATVHQVVFAMNTDYYTYRLGSGGSRHVGVVIRDGKILYDDRYPASNNYFPNLDTLAFFPDGTLSVAESYEYSAQDYIDQGAYAVYSFGPYLMKDGKLSESAYTARDTKNPRCAVGMVEPGHYVAILAEGRLKRSGGISLKGLALLMRQKGCQVAFNLDGGQTAVMCFMGVQLNKIGIYDGKTNARPTSEIMGIGHSEQVGNVEFQ